MKIVSLIFLLLTSLIVSSGYASTRCKNGLSELSNIDLVVKDYIGLVRSYQEAGSESPSHIVLKDLVEKKGTELEALIQLLSKEDGEKVRQNIRSSFETPPPEPMDDDKEELKAREKESLLIPKPFGEQLDIPFNDPSGGSHIMQVDVLSPSHKLIAQALEDVVKIYTAGGVYYRGIIPRGAREDIGRNITRIAFSGNGSQLFIGLDNGGVEVWDIRNNKYVKNLKSPYSLYDGDIRRVSDITYSPDKKYLVTTSTGDGGETLIRDAPSLTLKSRIFFPGLKPNRAWLSPDNKFLMAQDRDLQIMIWDISKAKFEKGTKTLKLDAAPHRIILPNANEKMEKGDWSYEEVLEFSDVFMVPKSHTVIVQKASKIFTWNLDANQPGGVFIDDQKFEKAHQSENQKYVALQYSYEVVIFNADLSRKLNTFKRLSPGSKQIEAITIFGKSNPKIAILYKDWQIGIWDVESGSLLEELRMKHSPLGNDAEIQSLGATRDGAHIFFTSISDSSENPSYLQIRSRK